MNTELSKMADVIVNYSLAVQPGERVLIRSTSPAGQPLAQAIYQAALQAGSEAFTYIHMADEDVLAIEATDNPELLGAVNPMLKLMYETCHAVVRIDAPENPRVLSDYPPEMQRARARSGAAVIHIQMEREGNGSMRRCTTQFPTRGLAQAAGMSQRQYANFVFEACKLHLDDPVAAWRQVEQTQQQLVDWLAGKNNVHVRGKNIDLHLSIDGRKFINACGTCNFPDGEIFTGPVEDSINGWVRFSYPAFYRGNEVVGAELTFENGVITKATATKNEEFLLSVLDTDPGARRLGEFAIGTNREIQRFTGSILFDEKIGGTVHMAVGQGYPETGSINQSSIHWDMICDLRDDSEITVDGELFYKDGEFVV